MYLYENYLNINNSINIDENLTKKGNFVYFGYNYITILYLPELFLFF